LLRQEDQGASLAATGVSWALLRLLSMLHENGCLHTDAVFSLVLPKLDSLKYNVTAQPSAC